MTTRKSETVTWKVGRDAKDGEFISVKEAQRRHDTATVETMRRPRFSEDGESK